MFISTAGRFSFDHRITTAFVCDLCHEKAAIGFDSILRSNTTWVVFLVAFNDGIRSDGNYCRSGCSRYWTLESLTTQRRFVLVCIVEDCKTRSRWFGNWSDWDTFV